jgi:hypothetical protein
MKSVLFGAGPVLLLAAMAGAASFEHEYSPAAGVMPQDSTPTWALRHGGGTIQANHGVLRADMPAGERSFFVIGRLDDEAYGDVGAWNATTGRATVEFRVRCESDDPSLEVFQLHLSDGRLQWRIRFCGDKIFPRRVAVDTGEADTYRAVLRDGRLTLSSERQGVIFADVPGNESYAGKPTRSHALLFGSFDPNTTASGATTSWELDFLRWTNQEALPDL